MIKKEINSLFKSVLGFKNFLNSEATLIDVNIKKIKKIFFIVILDFIL